MFAAREPFADADLVPGASVIRASHITDLRSRINALRTQYELEAYAWPASQPVSRITGIRAMDVASLRSALNEIYVAIDRSPPPQFTDDPLLVGVRVKAIHILELRAAVLAIE